MISIGFCKFHKVRGTGRHPGGGPGGGIKGGCFAMYTNAMFCNLPSLTHRGWALASHTRPVGLPRRFAAVQTWIPLASWGARPDRGECGRLGRP